MIRQFKGPYEFLSNFHLSPMKVERFGRAYTVDSVEHAYQAMKARDPIDFIKICNAATPGIARKLGRKLPLRTDIDWEQEKVRLMRALLREKFRDPELRRLLLATGDEELEEGNWWGDRFWGVCEGDGQNVLGKLLMEIRKELSA